MTRRLPSASMGGYDRRQAPIWGPQMAKARFTSPRYREQFGDRPFTRNRSSKHTGCNEKPKLC